MKTATVADLRNHFPRVFRWIAEGEKVEVTRRGRPVAHLVPAPKPKPRKFRMPDFARMRRDVLGADLKSRRLSEEDSAFIRDRGER